MSDIQLNATASVPKTFVYTPLAGTVLGLGTHTLYITFTSTDAVNYTEAYATALINVKEIPTITWSNFAYLVYGIALI
jgi:hypothetical protein